MRVLFDIPDKYISTDIPLNDSIQNADNDNALGIKVLLNHGDLIDREELKSKFSGDDMLNITLRKCFDEIEAVIPSDKGEE